MAYKVIILYRLYMPSYFLGTFTEYPWSKAALYSQGTPIEDLDLFIGCTAVANQMIMVTENKKHLERIPNIEIENWVHRG